MSDEFQAATSEAVRVLRAGGLVAIPTETVYGLAADATNEDAVRKVFAVKGRPVDHPLIVHVADAARIDDWAMDVPAAARTLGATFWPGPLTLVLWRATHVHDVVTGGLDTVGLRVPRHPATLAVLRELGTGVAAPSANRFGRVSPTSAEHVREDLGADVDFVLDGGPSGVGLESTILDLTGEVPTVLRLGAITAEAISTALGAPVEAQAKGPSRAPGMLAAHYAPRARVTIASADAVETIATRAADAGRRAGILAMGASSGDPRVRVFDLGADEHDAARRLYAALRAADAEHVDELFVVLPERVGVGAAIADRLVRAAATFLGDGTTHT